MADAMQRKRDGPVENDDEGFEFWRMKKRKEVVFRSYPKGCGINAPASVEARQSALPDVGVYATRTFPKGCGRNVPRCNPALQRKVPVDRTEAMVFSARKDLGREEFREATEVDETSVPDEAPDLLLAMKSEVAGLFDQKIGNSVIAEAVEEVKILVPDEAPDSGNSFMAEAVEEVETFVSDEAPDLGKSLLVDAIEEVGTLVTDEALHLLPATKSETTELLDKKEVLDSGDSFMVEAIEEVGTFVTDEARQSLLAMKSETAESLDKKESFDLRDSFMSEAVEEGITLVLDESPCKLEDLASETKTKLDQSEAPEQLRSFKTKELDQPERSFPCRIEEVSVYLKLPQRRISSARRFPAGCGRVAISRSMVERAKQAECSLYSRSGHEKLNAENGVRPIVRANGKERRVVEDEDALKGKLKGHAMREITLTQSVNSMASFDSKLKRNDGIKGTLEKYCSSKLLDRSYSKNQHESVRGSTSGPSYKNKNKEDKDSVPLPNEAEIAREKAAREKINKSRRLFALIYEELLRDKEAKRNNIRRIDCEAAKILKDRNTWVHSGEPILGVVPGVKVGDKFRYRAEVAIVGLHRHYQSGIDYLKRWDGKLLATSIVASGGYDDYKCGPDVIVYSGQGGNPGQGKEATDQKLEKGNLALKNSKDEQTPVRVIRGGSETKGRDSVSSRINSGATLTYDGLYLVEDYWASEGRHGKNVFMFQLRRMPGQPQLPKD